MLFSGFLAGMLAIAAAEPTSATGKIETWRLDGNRSSATFSVRVLWMISIDGTFRSVHGDVHIDRFLDQARVDARIDTNSVSMRRNGVEDWVKSPEFFDVEQFPEIRFQSDPFPLSRLDAGGALPGSLTLRGIRRPVMFALQASKCARPAIDCQVEANGAVRRTDFGMRTRRAALADKVDLSFSIRISDSPPPPVEQ